MPQFVQFLSLMQYLSGPQEQVILNSFLWQCPKKHVVAEVANNCPNQADQSVRRVTCSQAALNTKKVQQQNEEDLEQDVRSDRSQVDGPPELKEAESEESKHVVVQEADEIGTEKDAASSTSPAN